LVRVKEVRLFSLQLIVLIREKLFIVKEVMWFLSQYNAWILTNASIPVRSLMFLLETNIFPNTACASLTCICPSLFKSITGLWVSNAFLKLASGIFTICALVAKIKKQENVSSRNFFM